MMPGETKTIQRDNPGERDGLATKASGIFLQSGADLSNLLILLDRVRAPAAQR
jgi:hypothetical protein